MDIAWVWVITVVILLGIGLVSKKMEKWADKNLMNEDLLPPCKECDGSGYFMPGQRDCPQCYGSGVAPIASASPRWKADGTSDKEVK
jgi:hypothetical protein